ncbi:hypothetical protein [Pontibacter actiniarum]|uniref:Uncharacterized protein n=1 Tax=Pontibacter actiniarum TaxID=323450 RepID=A0A1X9YXW2_9BACT|nr:hypothetical protein [Pontibacter actiniarum]ARS37584.1 hypothetical protein CA264_20330 [Pontibacter actiniarum]
MFLLRLRHWQAFLLLFVLPFLVQYGLLALLDALNVRTGDAVAMLIDALPATVYTLWLWQTGLWLRRRLPASIKPAPLYFHLGTLYLLLYTLLLVYTLALVRESVVGGTLPLGMLVLLVPLHLLATLCYLYIVYFMARLLVEVEQQRAVDFGEFAGTYFFFLLLPLGIWFLQPRLRRLYLTEAQANEINTL